LLLLVPLSAFAQPRDEALEPAGYRAAIDAAVQEHELNHYAESREHFARAHALLPNARTLRGLGVADFELRRYVDAVKELAAALATPAKRLEGSLRSDTEALLAQARAYVGETHLRLYPPDATLRVDGVETVLGPEASLMIEVGDHELEISAPGRLTQRRTLRVRGQQKSELHVTLPPSDVAAEPAARAAQGPPRRRGRRVATWILGGLTVALTGAVVGLAVAVENTEDSFQACIQANGACEHLAEQGTRLERARNAMIGVASAAAVGTLVSFFVEGRAKRATQVALGVSPTGARLAATF
jgi:hypothetical protein